MIISRHHETNGHFFNSAHNIHKLFYRCCIDVDYVVCPGMCSGWYNQGCAGVDTTWDVLELVTTWDVLGLVASWDVLGLCTTWDVLGLVATSDVLGLVQPGMCCGWYNQGCVGVGTSWDVLGLIQPGMCWGWYNRGCVGVVYNLGCDTVYTCTLLVLKLKSDSACQPSSLRNFIYLFISIYLYRITNSARM